MKIVIIGKRSFLSKQLKSSIKNSIILSSNFLKNKKLVKKHIIDNNIFIINSFYPLFKILSNKTNNVSMTRQSIGFILKFLKAIKNKKDIKIIYSSTCAVKNFETDQFDSRSVYTSQKVLCEQVLKEYCDKYKINLVVTRLFNLFGGHDRASIIFKILSATQKSPIIINNGGNSKRDFIHVKDVALIYKKLIKSNFSGYIDVGTGKSVAIKKLINLKNKKFFLNKNKIFEKKTSVANVNLLKKVVDIKKFIKVEEFVKKRIK